MLRTESKVGVGFLGVVVCRSDLRLWSFLTGTWEISSDSKSACGEHTVVFCTGGISICKEARLDWDSSFGASVSGGIFFLSGIGSLSLVCDVDPGEDSPGRSGRFAGTAGHGQTWSQSG